MTRDKQGDKLPSRDELVSAFKGKIGFTVGDTHIWVRTVYNPDTVKFMKRIRAVWVSERQAWRVQYKYHQLLLDRADQIDVFLQSGAADALEEKNAHRHVEKRIWVEKAELARYRKGATVFHDNMEYVVAYVGRIPTHSENGITYRVYLEPQTPQSIEVNHDDDFNR